MIYLTGDTHGNFARIEDFCEEYETTREDVLIILGDAGINYSGGRRDYVIKQTLKELPITFFCIHGNHEQRPNTIAGYKETLWRGGIVYYEEEYPNLLFAKDGEIFDLDGQKAIVIGGAYSIDKDLRLAEGEGWWPDEQPSDEVKQYVEKQLAKLDWKIDLVLSHTTPLKYEPTEVFLDGIDQSTVDKSTEEWLDTIEDRLDYWRWYCGHYHTEKEIDGLIIMYENYEVLDDWLL